MKCITWQQKWLSLEKGSLEKESPPFLPSRINTCSVYLPAVLHQSSLTAERRAAAAPAGKRRGPQRSAQAGTILLEQTMGTGRLRFPNSHQAYQIHSTVLVLKTIN